MDIQETAGKAIDADATPVSGKPGERTSERIFRSALPIWERCYQHPFVQGLGDGSLSHDRFAHFMVQDHKYLSMYARVFALGVVKSECDRDAREFASFITSTFQAEQSLHDEYLGQLGISPEEVERTPMSLANNAYTSYMMNVALREGSAEIMAAVTACSWSYKYIGDKLEARENATSDEFYAKWRHTYSSEWYRASNDHDIEMLDRLSADYTPERVARLERIVLDCSEFEYRFWDMCWNKE